ncbi:MAG: diacylglycerol/lipid kinase family protein [Planctomycetota bacterium]
MQVAIIANPRSGRGLGPARARGIATLLGERGHQVSVHSGAGAADAAAWAARAGPKADRLVVIGGDGSLHAVLSGLDDSPPPIAAVPLGTSNLVGARFRMPRSPQGVVRLLETGRVQPVDLARVNGRKCFLAWGFGHDGELMRRMEKTRDGPIRKTQYVPILWSMLHGWDPPLQRVTADGEDLGEFRFGFATGLGTYASGWVRLGPAGLEDGLWELFLFPRLTLLGSGPLALAALVGGLRRFPGVVFRQARRITVGGERPAPIEIDGDHAGATPLTFEVTTEKLPLLVPSP